MEPEFLAFRAVPNGDGIIVSVYVESAKRWFDTRATKAQVAAIAEIFQEAASKAQQK